MRGLPLKGRFSFLFYAFVWVISRTSYALPNNDHELNSSNTAESSASPIEFRFLETSDLYRHIKSELEVLNSLESVLKNKNIRDFSFNVEDGTYSPNPDGNSAGDWETASLYSQRKRYLDIFTKLRDKLNEIEPKISAEDRALFNATKERVEKVAVEADASKQLASEINGLRKKNPLAPQTLKDKENALNKITDTRNSILNHAESGAEIGPNLEVEYLEALEQLKQAEEALKIKKPSSDPKNINASNSLSQWWNWASSGIGSVASGLSSVLNQSSSGNLKPTESQSNEVHNEANTSKFGTDSKSSNASSHAENLVSPKESAKPNLSSELKPNASTTDSNKTEMNSRSASSLGTNNDARSTQNEVPTNNLGSSTSRSETKSPISYESSNQPSTNSDYPSKSTNQPSDRASSFNDSENAASQHNLENNPGSQSNRSEKLSNKFSNSPNDSNAQAGKGSSNEENDLAGSNLSRPGSLNSNSYPNGGLNNPYNGIGNSSISAPKEFFAKNITNKNSTSSGFSSKTDESTQNQNSSENSVGTEESTDSAQVNNPSSQTGPNSLGYSPRKDKLSQKRKSKDNEEGLQNRREAANYGSISSNNFTSNDYSNPPGKSPKENLNTSFPVTKTEFEYNRDGTFSRIKPRILASNPEDSSVFYSNAPSPSDNLTKVTSEIKETNLELALEPKESSQSRETLWSKFSQPNWDSLTQILEGLYPLKGSEKPTDLTKFIESSSAKGTDSKIKALTNLKAELEKKSKTKSTLLSEAKNLSQENSSILSKFLAWLGF